MAEQNLAFSCIEAAFDELPHKPDKKSLKQDAQGKYLELAFVTPDVGRRYRETLQALASQTGWRIRIADKVNQNALFKAAQMLCMKQGIDLVKNPSYLPEQKMVQLRLKGVVEEEKLRAMEEEFKRRTGCECVFVE